MPWKETCAMDERLKLIGDWLRGKPSVSELSETYGVSRKTVYKWLSRYDGCDLDGLKERSRAPLHHPNATPQEIVEMIVRLKKGHLRWGAKKLLAFLERDHPESRWPALSTVNVILDRHSLVKHRHPRHHTPPYTEPFEGCYEPNAVWSADYKGQFRLGNGRLCYPLTITDNYSRYLLGCWALERPSYDESRPWFEKTFQEYGLPWAIRTDNGSPFAGVGLGGLSRLSVWFIKLGIRPERIAVGQPQQNGRHERMHRTLKEEAVAPPRDNQAQQQRVFERFKDEFNNRRPHEALGQHTPASVYRPSARSYPARAPKVEYDSGVTVRHIHKGYMKWQGNFIYVSENLSGEDIALKRVSENEWELSFSFHHLGTFDERSRRIRP